MITFMNIFMTETERNNNNNMIMIMTTTVMIHSRRTNLFSWTCCESNPTRLFCAKGRSKENVQQRFTISCFFIFFKDWVGQVEEGRPVTNGKGDLSSIGQLKE